MTENAKGVVIQSSLYKDSDRIITILTDNMGKVSARARSIGRKNSGLAAAVQPFTYSSFVLYKNGKNFSVNEADIIEQFAGMAVDLEKNALASYFCSLASFFEENDEDSGEFLRLMLNSFYALDRDIAPVWKVKAVFEIKCAVIWGYSPSLTALSPLGDSFYISCGDGSLSSFMPKEGGTEFDKSALAALSYIIKADMKKMLSFNVDDVRGKMLSDFTRGYILNKTEYKPRALSFYESLGDMPKGVIK